MSKKRFIVLFLAGVFLVVLSAGGYLLGTPEGSLALSKFVFPKILKARKVTIAAGQGTLLGSLRLSGVRAEGIQWLPYVSAITLKEAHIRLFSGQIVCKDASVVSASFSDAGAGAQLTTIHFLPSGIDLFKVFNGSLFFGPSCRLNFNGQLLNKELQVNIFAKQCAAARSLKVLFPKLDSAGLAATVSDFDLYIWGPLKAERIRAEFLLDPLTYKNISLQECRIKTELQFDHSDKTTLGIRGEVLSRGGKLRGEKTAVIQLDAGKLIFLQDPMNPRLEIKGTSLVDDVKISAFLQGTLRAPELRVTSDPPLPQTHLLLMLATNKKWAIVTDKSAEVKIPVEVAADFIDHFLLGSPAEELTKWIGGPPEVSVSLEQGSKMLQIKKGLGDKVGVSYSVEQGGADSSTDASRKVGLDYKLSDSISAEASRTVTSPSVNATQESTEPPENTFLLKYKHKF